MDGLLNKAKAAVSGNKSTTGTTNTTSSSSGGGEDYGDKGIDAVEKKFGMDPNKMRANNEKFSDMGREQFEKRTGKDIPDKFSN